MVTLTHCGSLPPWSIGLPIILLVLWIFFEFEDINPNKSGFVRIFKNENWYFINSCQSAATFKIVKVLLVFSLSHVRSAVASTGLCLYLYL